jgi:hypothetical protein
VRVSPDTFSFRNESDWFRNLLLVAAAVALTLASPPCLNGGPAFGLVAQLVEQRTENPRVGGSIPSQATNPYRSFRL